MPGSASDRLKCDFFSLVSLMTLETLANQANLVCAVEAQNTTAFIYFGFCTYVLVAWYSGRTLVFDRRTFPVLRWWVTTYVGKPSAVGQPTRPTQPFILSG